MGEVYRARDTRLDRTVAIKVLPSHLSDKPEARERFEREAKSISGLNHPNICTLHDVGHQDGIDFLVMEYLEGETLATRLTRGRLPLPEVVKWGSEICAGLEKAHRAGVVHRDLKPGNIMLTKTGAKLMDFGLAKTATGTSSSSSPAALTMTSPGVGGSPLTAEGMLVGTFQYMSPEQAEGHEADARSDIFALGAVLYEMLTGKRAFEGKTVASTIAAILAAEPKPVSTLQPLTPAAIDHLVQTCLAKDPDQRWQSAGDVARQLQWIAQGRADGRPAVHGSSSPRAWILAASVLALVAGAFWLGSTRNNYAPSVVQFEVASPEKTYFNFRGLSGPPVPSPDGTKLVFAAYAQGQAGQRSLWLRSLNSSEVKPVSGSEEATYPFWSPDGRYLAFFAGAKLKKFDLAAASLVSLCNVAEGRGGAWSTNGVIIFGNRADGLFRVDAAGGAPVRLTTLDNTRQEASHRWPQFLPDQKRFLFVAQAPEIPTAHLAIASLDAPQAKLLTELPAVASLAGQFLVYVQENNLFARSFDADRLQFTGEPTALAQNVQTDSQFNNAVFAVSGSTLAYQTGAVVAGTRLVVFDRDGKETVLSRESDLIQAIALAPQGDKIALNLGIASGQLSDVWIYNLLTNNKARLTFDQHSFTPIWSPDGKRMAIQRGVADGYEIVIRDVWGGGSEEKINKENQRIPLIAWSADGNSVLYRLGLIGAEIKAVSLRPPHKSVVLTSTKVGWAGAALSPNGRWLAYTSEESGLPEVYVVPFHTGAEGPSIAGGKWQVSSGGGNFPGWRPDGKELFFAGLGGTTLWSASVRETGERFESDVPRFLFDIPARPVGAFYSPSADGRKIYMATYGPGSTAPITVTLNWQTLVKK
jgi:serine/threonine protein kinase